MGMTETMTEPISTRNLDRYGSPELPWSRPRDILVSDTPKADLTFFVATVRPNGRPHSAGVGAVWVGGGLYFTSGPGTLKSRNLAVNPACSVSVRLSGIDLVLEGEAHRVTEASTLERLAAVYRTSGWPASVEGRRAHGPVQRAQRGPRPLAPVPPHAAHSRRRSLRRAPRRHPLGLRPLRRAGLPPRPCGERA
jgi:Pyridoxamine 5'-phosphate oxidase